MKSETISFIMGLVGVLMTVSGSVVNNVTSGQHGAAMGLSGILILAATLLTVFWGEWGRK
jgi:TRAP-type mannitol/chloroaromatic compound transport system permease large subunit